MYQQEMGEKERGGDCWKYNSQRGFKSQREETGTHSTLLESHNCSLWLQTARRVSIILENFQEI